MTKIPEEILLDLKVDEATIIKQLLDIEEKTKQVDELVEQTKKKSRTAWLMAVGVAQATWQLTSSLTSMMGITMSQVTKQVIQGIFTSASLLIPLFTAQALTPGLQVAAGLGLAMVGLAIGNAIVAERQFQQEQSKISSNTMTILGDINSLIGSFNY